MCRALSYDVRMASCMTNATVQPIKCILIIHTLPVVKETVIYVLICQNRRLMSLCSRYNNRELKSRHFWWIVGEIISWRLCRETNHFMIPVELSRESHIWCLSIEKDNKRRLSDWIVLISLALSDRYANHAKIYTANATISEACMYN